MNEELAATWQTHIEQWQESDLTQTEYCRQHGLKTYTFRYWKLKNQPAEEAVFVEVPAAAPSTCAPLFELRLSESNGLEIRLNLNWAWSGRLFA